MPATPYTGTLTYTYTANSISSNVSVNVNGPASPVININSGSPVLCNGSTVQLCPLIWGFSNYQWYKDGYAIAGASGTSSCITVDASGIGSYTLAGTNGSGCWSVPSATLVVSTVNSLSIPTITVTGPTTLCSNATTILTSSSTFGNQWFKNGNATGVTSQSYTVSDPANYSVLVSNGNCASAMSLATTITSNNVPASIGGETTVVAGSTTQLTSATPGGVWTSNSSVATVSSTGLVTGVTAGSAIITYTVTNSCGSSSVTQFVNVTSASVTVWPNPATNNVQVIFTGPTTTGFVINIVNSSNTLVRTENVGIQTINSTVSTSFNVNSLPNGTYFISIYDTQGHLISTTQLLKN